MTPHTEQALEGEAPAFLLQQPGPQQTPAAPLASLQYFVQPRRLPPITKLNITIDDSLLDRGSHIAPGMQHYVCFARSMCVLDVGTLSLSWS